MQNQLILKPVMTDTALLPSFVDEAAGAAGISERETKRLLLAVEETVANVINYGQATVITLRAAEATDRLVLTIDDNGQPFDPTQGSQTDLSVPADQRPPGGMGIILMHTMSDALGYQRVNGHNILKIEKLKK